MNAEYRVIHLDGIFTIRLVENLSDGSIKIHDSDFDKSKSVDELSHRLIHLLSALTKPIVDCTIDGQNHIQEALKLFDNNEKE